MPYLEKCEIISPQPGGSLLNEKVVQYELRQAEEIWAGDISPNGMLAAWLTASSRKPGGEARASVVGCAFLTGDYPCFHSQGAGEEGDGYGGWVEVEGNKNERVSI